MNTLNRGARAFNRVVKCRPARAILPQAANDNLVNPLKDSMLRAALKHFAQHGLGAAQNARMRAQEARFAGDHAAYRWWRDMCRSLDARMASALPDPEAAC
ncbi:hypothetical protein [Qipengyuania atrilutea]|uniref:Uncharacterized protein n=1 Tax=Qipengyuania atrilutea TaxID=2744473 RepID=A0A850H1F3_9SPHN|nr:hypothetical protein [Actirhodobacter atriluteus]NVD44072.1 hypothetical protein [Actirhodobacter atriluteus]